MPLPRSTARLILRRLRVTDLTAFQAYRQSEELSRYQGWTPQPEAEALAFLHEMASITLFQRQVWAQIGIAERIDDKLIGDIGICVAADGRCADIGFTLSQPYHGRGLASEAVCETIAMLFEETDVDRVFGITDSRNVASIRLLERIGMTLQSTDKAMFRGHECDEHTYCIARSASPSQP